MERWDREKQVWVAVKDIEIHPGDLVRVYLTSLGAYLIDQFGFEFHYVAESVPDQNNPKKVRLWFIAPQVVSRAVH